MKPFNLLRWLTPLALLLAIGTAVWVFQATASLSPGMKRRAQLGFHHGLDQPGLAVQLAGTPAEFCAIFGLIDPDPEKRTKLTETERTQAVKDSAPDREAVIGSLHRDFLFIPAYTLLWIVLGLRAWQRTAPHSTAVRVSLLVIPLAVALGDVLENFAGLSALKSYPAIDASTLVRGSTASWGKWLLSFMEMIVLGISLLRVDGPRPRAFLPNLGGLMLLVGGTFGLSSVFWPSFIPNAFGLGMLAALPFCAMVFYPDSAWRDRCTPGDLTWRKPAAGV